MLCKLFLQNLTIIFNKYILNIFFSGHQPIVQQFKSCFDDVKEIFLSENTKTDTKIDALIQLQCDQLELE